MNIDSSRTLTHAISKASLLTAAQQKEVTKDLAPRFADARSLARQLLDRGWVTSFQINQIFMGRGGDLTLGPYILLERLGEGGTGQVFKARHQHMNRVVALKLIRKELLTDQEVVRRFYREIQLVSTLTHPHVVHAYDAGPIGPNYFLVMEFVEGTDLSHLVKQTGPLAVKQACTYIRQAALGLQHIHERNLVHRDIKASNLLVTGWNAAAGRNDRGSEFGPWGLLKILDLGLARLHRPINSERTSDLTENGQVMMGTLDYMAPEQAVDFHRADIRADIYSLGCTFYFLLTGRPPFADGTVAQKLLRHQQAEPTPVEKARHDLPPGLTAVLQKMMAKRPEDRYQKPAEVADLLTGPASSANTSIKLPVPVHTIRATVRYALRPFRGQVVDVYAKDRRGSGGLARSWLARLRRRSWLLVAGVPFLLLTGLLLYFFLFRSSSTASGPGGTLAKSQAVDGSKLTYLSDLEALNFQGGAFAKNGFLGHNGNGNLGPSAEGARIIVKGVLSRKGVSMLAPSQGAANVSYRLGKQYQTFKSSVALHDGGWFSGSKVTFVVLGEGKVLWQSKTIASHQDFPQECEVSIAGVDVLELQVTCTSNNNGVWPVWLDPYVTK